MSEQPEPDSGYGLPIPAAPVLSLPERLRTEVWHLIESDRAETRVTDLLREAADTLEAGSQP